MAPFRKVRGAVASVRVLLCGLVPHPAGPRAGAAGSTGTPCPVPRAPPWAPPAPLEPLARPSECLFSAPLPPGMPHARPDRGPGAAALCGGAPAASGTQCDTRHGPRPLRPRERSVPQVAARGGHVPVLPVPGSLVVRLLFSLAPPSSGPREARPCPRRIPGRLLATSTHVRAAWRGPDPAGPVRAVGRSGPVRREDARPAPPRFWEDPGHPLTLAAPSTPSTPSAPSAPSTLAAPFRSAPRLFPPRRPRRRWQPCAPERVGAETCGGTGERVVVAPATSHSDGAARGRTPVTPLAAGGGTQPPPAAAPRRLKQADSSRPPSAGASRRAQ